MREAGMENWGERGMVLIEERAVERRDSSGDRRENGKSAMSERGMSCDYRSVAAVMKLHGGENGRSKYWIEMGRTDLERRLGMAAVGGEVRARRRKNDLQQGMPNRSARAADVR